MSAPRILLRALPHRPSTSSLLRPPWQRLFSSTASTRYPPKKTDFSADRPAPPRLPPELQKEFEELQRSAAMPMASSSVSSNGPEIAFSGGDEGEFHPDMRRKPKPEFEGEVNPRTGEVGGPKNDPLSYEKEWSYGGRATDF